MGLFRLLRRKKRTRNQSRRVEVRLQPRGINPSCRGAVPHTPPKYKAPHPPLEGMVSRTSYRWFDCQISKRVFTPIPFVNRSGKFSINTLCFWTAYPEQIVASLCSTVYNRLLRIIANRFTWRYAVGNRQLLLKISALYTVTHHDSMLDRFLGILRKEKGIGAAQRLCYHYTCKLGAHTRFVYNQLTSLSLWLTFRSTTCRRDKPSKEFGGKAHTTIGGEDLWPVRQIYQAFRGASLTWRPWEDRISGGQHAHSVKHYVERGSVFSSENPEEYWRSEDMDKWSWASHETQD